MTKRFLSIILFLSLALYAFADYSDHGRPSDLYDDYNCSHSLWFAIFILVVLIVVAIGVAGKHVWDNHKSSIKVGFGYIAFFGSCILIFYVGKACSKSHTEENGVVIYPQQQAQSAFPSNNTQSVITKEEATNSIAPSVSSQNDLMMNIVANPTFSLEDFVTIGFNKDNVSLQDIQTYRADPYIRSKFEDEFGNMNEMRLQSVYHKATEWFERLQKDVIHIHVEPSYHRDNIFAPMEQRRQGPDYEELIKTE